MGDGVLNALGMFEGLSSIAVLCVLLVWFARQVFLTFREGRTSTTDLAENTIKLLTQEQEKTTDLNNRVDNLYAENRMLRSDLHDLKVKYEDLLNKHEEATNQINYLETQVKNLKRNGETS